LQWVLPKDTSSLLLQMRNRAFLDKILPLLVRKPALEEAHGTAICRKFVFFTDRLPTVRSVFNLIWISIFGLAESHHDVLVVAICRRPKMSAGNIPGCR